MKSKKADRIYRALAAPALLILVFLFALPLYFTFSTAFEGGFDTIRSVFTSAYSYRLVRFTLIESLLSAFISCLVALPFAAFFASYDFRLRKMTLALSALSFTIPSILVVLGFVIFYGNNGVLNSLLKDIFSLEESPVRFLYSFSAIIFAHVYLNLPVAFNLITNGWTSLPMNEEMASYTLGRGKMKTFFSITLPKLRGVIANAFIIIFLFCFSSFAIVMVLGGSPEYSTLESEIYRRAHISLDYSGASALSIFSFIITTLALSLTYIGRRREKMVRREGRARKIKGKGMKALAALMTLSLLLFILPPMMSILYRSFFDRKGIFSLEAWNTVFSASSFLSSILNSLIIAITAAGLATILAENIAMYSVKCNSRISPLFATLPLATGSVTLGLGYNFLSSHLGINSIYFDYLMILATHLVLAIPFAIRTILPGAKEIPQRVSDASYTLKKSAFETYMKTERPLLKNYRRKAFIFAFALSLGEVNATLSLAGGRIETLPIQIYRLIGSYNYQGASALGSVLLFLAFIVFILGERIGKKERTWNTSK